jgi:thiamine-monophosphate kinase
MEHEFLEWLRPRLPPHPNLRLGVGDDAAIVTLARDAGCVVSVDLLSDGVDFRLAEVDPRRVGRKALAVNLSDLAAMAARPLAAVVALNLPRTGALQLAQTLYEGLLPLAAEYDLAIAGGDTNVWDGPLVVCVTVLGEARPERALRRSGGQPGDCVLVTGPCGGSILGRQFDFTPRVREALLLAERYEVHAAIDISDGLALDLSRLAAASGCGAVLRTSDVPIAAAAHELARQQPELGTPLDHALGDGEDFELLLALSPTEARRLLADQPLSGQLQAIGELTLELGLWEQRPDGTHSPLQPRGFVH